MRSALVSETPHVHLAASNRSTRSTLARKKRNPGTRFERQRTHAPLADADSSDVAATARTKIKIAVVVFTPNGYVGSVSVMEKHHYVAVLRSDWEEGWRGRAPAIAAPGNLGKIR